TDVVVTTIDSAGDLEPSPDLSPACRNNRLFRRAEPAGTKRFYARGEELVGEGRRVEEPRRPRGPDSFEQFAQPRVAAGFGRRPAGRGLRREQFSDVFAPLADRRVVAGRLALQGTDCLEDGVHRSGPPCSQARTWSVTFRNRSSLTRSRYT